MSANSTYAAGSNGPNASHIQTRPGTNQAQSRSSIRNRLAGGLSAETGYSHFYFPASKLITKLEYQEGDGIPTVNHLKECSDAVADLFEKRTGTALEINLVDGESEESDTGDEKLNLSFELLESGTYDPEMHWLEGAKCGRTKLIDLLARTAALGWKMDEADVLKLTSAFSADMQEIYKKYIMASDNPRGLEVRSSMDQGYVEMSGGAAVLRALKSLGRSGMRLNRDQSYTTYRCLTFLVDHRASYLCSSNGLESSSPRLPLSRQ